MGTAVPGAARRAIAASEAGEADAGAFARFAIVTDPTAIAGVQMAARALVFAVTPEVSVLALGTGAAGESRITDTASVSGDAVAAGSVAIAGIVSASRAFLAAAWSVKTRLTDVAFVSGEARQAFADGLGVDHQTQGVVATAAVVFTQVSPGIAPAGRPEQNRAQSQRSQEAVTLCFSVRRGLKIAGSGGVQALHI